MARTPTSVPAAAPPPPDPPPTPPAVPVAGGATMRLQMATFLMRFLGGDPAAPSGFTTLLDGLLRGQPPAAPAARPAPHPWTTIPGHPLADSSAEAELARAYRRPYFTGSLRLRGWRQFWPAYLLAAVGAMLALWWLFSVAAAWAGDRITTLQYGDPRTTHAVATFGLPGELAGAGTEITAVNDRGVIHIFLLPGGTIAHPQVVEMDFRDVDPGGRQAPRLLIYDADEDGHLDLGVQVGAIVRVYLYDTGKQTFRVPTAAEVGRLHPPPADGGTP